MGKLWDILENDEIYFLYCCSCGTNEGIFNNIKDNISRIPVDFIFSLECRGIIDTEQILYKQIKKDSNEI